MVLTRVGPVSLAKVALVFYGAIGLLVGIGFALASLMGAAAGMASGEDSAVVGMIFGVGAIVALPLLYGGFGAISALVFAALFNVIAGLTGGIELTLEQQGGARTAPGYPPA